MGYQMLLTELVAVVWQAELRKLGLQGSVSDIAQGMLEGKAKEVGAEFQYFLDVNHANFAAANRHAWP